MKLQARPSPIKRGSTPHVRRPVVTQMPKPVMQVAPAPKPAHERLAAPAAVQRPVRAVQRGGSKGPNCLWPIGDPGDQDFHFCGEPAVHGKPYCSEHCARAYIVRNRPDSEAA
jgi:GcrA cell cycle regulator